MCVCECMCVCMCACVRMCVYVCVCVYLCVCACVHACVCACVHVHACVCEVGMHACIQVILCCQLPYFSVLKLHYHNHILCGRTLSVHAMHKNISIITRVYYKDMKGECLTVNTTSAKSLKGYQWSLKTLIDDRQLLIVECCSKCKYLFYIEYLRILRDAVILLNICKLGTFPYYFHYELWIIRYHQNF